MHADYLFLKIMVQCECHETTIVIGNQIIYVRQAKISLPDHAQEKLGPASLQKPRNRCTYLYLLLLFYSHNVPYLSHKQRLLSTSQAIIGQYLKLLP
jgi:hypothetical protein